MSPVVGSAYFFNGTKVRARILRVIGRFSAGMGGGPDGWIVNVYVEKQQKCYGHCYLLPDSPAVYVKNPSQTKIMARYGESVLSPRRRNGLMQTGSKPPPKTN